jgi:hypothetical protein
MLGTSVKEAAMRILSASGVLIALLLLPGCATLQQYPAFGTDCGRLILFDRRGAHNVLPPAGRHMTAEPTATPDADPVR